MVASNATQGVATLYRVNNPRGGMVDRRRVLWLRRTVRVYFFLKGIDVSHCFSAVILECCVHLVQQFLVEFGITENEFLSKGREFSVHGFGKSSQIFSGHVVP